MLFMMIRVGCCSQFRGGRSVIVTRKVVEKSSCYKYSSTSFGGFTGLVKGSWEHIGHYNNGYYNGGNDDDNRLTVMMM